MFFELLDASFHGEGWAGVRGGFEDGLGMGMIVEVGNEVFTNIRR